MIAISPQYLALSKLLDGRLFCIPEYQRAYSWTHDERKDLFSDIEKVYSKGADEAHFMAAVVCLRRKKQIIGTDEFHLLEIVDGQQRLTTLIILLNSLKLALDSTKKVEAKLSHELSELLVKSEGDELLLLQTNHDSSHHFANFLRTGNAEPPTTAKTVADREILNAIEDSKSFISNWKKNSREFSDLAAILKNRLFFLLHEIEDEKTVYTVFEVLNSRGLDVSWIDRLKSILMAAAFELKNVNHPGLITDLHNTWRDIYNISGLRQGLSTEALRFTATLLANEAPHRPLGEKDSVNVLRSAAGSAKQIRNVASWLLRVTKTCDLVTNNPRLNAVTRISQVRLLATAIYLREDINEQQREVLLTLWEKVSFRIYGLLGNDARTRVGDYVRLAWKIINENISAKSIEMAIKEIGQQFSIEDAIENMRGSNCYEGWETELRYFMFRYEENLARKQKLNFKNEQWEKIWMASASDSIEHILAKSKAHQTIKHCLGNLVLLPPRLNSTLGNDSPMEKSEAYRQTGLLIAGEVANIINTSKWTKKIILDREAALLEWAAIEWAD